MRGSGATPPAIGNDEERADEHPGEAERRARALRVRDQLELDDVIAGRHLDAHQREVRAPGRDRAGVVNACAPARVDLVADDEVAAAGRGDANAYSTIA